MSSNNKQTRVNNQSNDWLLLPTQISDCAKRKSYAWGHIRFPYLSTCGSNFAAFREMPTVTDRFGAWNVFTKGWKNWKNKLPCLRVHKCASYRRCNVVSKIYKSNISSRLILNCYIVCINTAQVMFAKRGGYPFRLLYCIYIYVPWSYYWHGSYYCNAHIHCTINLHKI